MIWEPAEPLVKWFNGHPWWAAATALVLPGIPQCLMGYWLVGCALVLMTVGSWTFFMGWVIHFLAAGHAYWAAEKLEKA